MSKKSRRARAKFRVPQNVAGSGELRRPETAAVVAEPRTAKFAAPAPAVSQVARYQHIAPELWRIGIISGVLFLIIIVLSFIIQ